MGAFSLQSAPFSAYSLPAMIMLEGLRIVPTGFLLLMPLLLRFDPAVEDAAAMAGARASTVTRRITLPLLLPGLLSIALYMGVTVLSIFELAGIMCHIGRIFVLRTIF